MRDQPSGQGQAENATVATRQNPLAERHADARGKAYPPTITTTNKE